MPVAKSMIKTIGRVARCAPVKSVGKALKKEATKAAVETAIEALEGQPVGRKAKQRLKSSTCGILNNAARQADSNDKCRTQNSNRKRKPPSITQSWKKGGKYQKNPCFKNQ